MPGESAAHRLLPQLRRIARARTEDASDGQLLKSFLETRDESAFDAIVRRHGPMVFGVCRRVIADAHLAEDAFQAVFLVLARRAATVRPRQLGAWLYGVSYRTAMKARGVAARRKSREQQVDSMPHPSVSPEEMWTDLQPIIDEELSRLPEKYRIPLVLCDLGGRPQRDVAKELNLPAATLANRLAQGRRVLAKRLTVRGITLSSAAIASALGWHAATSAVPPQLLLKTAKSAVAPAAAQVVSSQIIELSEGVMRMFLLSKLKSTTIVMATGLVLLCGLGVVSQATVRADPEPKAVITKAAPNAKPPATKEATDDMIFLRRTSLDLRGMLPTVIESKYFVDDKDARKRNKVVGWMLEDHSARPTVASCAACHDVPEQHGLSRLGLDGAHHKLGEWKTELGMQHKASNLLLAEWLRLPKTSPNSLGEDTGISLLRLFEKQQADERARAWKAFERTDGAQVEFARKDDAARAGQPGEDTKPKADDDAKADRLLANRRRVFGYYKTLQDTDAEFLRRVIGDVTGTAPTKLELNYFLADRDPERRRKIIDILLGSKNSAKTGDKYLDSFLADPEIAKQYQVWWKKQLDESAAKASEALRKSVAKSSNDPLTRLLGSLLAGKANDPEILDAISLAALARMPTDAEKNLILQAVANKADRKAAWSIVVEALCGTGEAKVHAEALGRRSSPK